MEFAMSQELQPYVIKVYENNGLIAVSEYVTVISKEEFEEKKEKIREILSILAESYLLGDVGTVTKNFMNWGYRDNKELVILDFAYVYRVSPNELLCRKCNTIVSYDENFYNLICPKCGDKYTFLDMRRRISKEMQDKEINMGKELAYKVTKSIQEIDEDNNKEEKNNLNNEEEKEMTKKHDKYLIDSNYEDLERKKEEEYYNELRNLQKLRINNQEKEQSCEDSENVNSNHSDEHISNQENKSIKNNNDTDVTIIYPEINNKASYIKVNSGIKQSNECNNELKINAEHNNTIDQYETLYKEIDRIKEKKKGGNKKWDA
jgi:predicted RNA-binding Zn-ribbon protein involved in translation (DUF1610 family)